MKIRNHRDEVAPFDTFTNTLQVHRFRVKLKTLYAQYTSRSPPTLPYAYVRI